MSSNHFRVRDATLGDAERVAALVTQLSYQTSVNDMKLRLERLLPHPEHIMLLSLLHLYGVAQDKLGTSTGPLPGIEPLEIT